MKALLAFGFAAPLALALQPAPLLAQSNDQIALADGEEGDGVEALLGLFGGMFAAEPLTAEQQARLPAATALIERIIPPGTMGEVMGALFDGMLGPIMEMAQGEPSAALADQLGLERAELDLDDRSAAEAAAILDPVWQQRREVEVAVFPEVMNTMMDAMEPTVKTVMAELYAINFDARELADIDAFFATPSGAGYARKSLTMSSDPRMVGAMMQAMPTIFSSLSEMEAQLSAATADLPAPRRFPDLAPAERDRLAALLGLSVNELKQTMLAAEE